MLDADELDEVIERLTLLPFLFVLNHELGTVAVLGIETDSVVMLLGLRVGRGGVALGDGLLAPPTEVAVEGTLPFSFPASPVFESRFIRFGKAFLNTFFVFSIDLTVNNCR